MISFIKGGTCPNLPGPTGKMNSPLLLNHEKTVINHIILESWVKFHKPTPGLITGRSVESRNHLNRTCLTKWSMLKEQNNKEQKTVKLEFIFD